ncbi:MAG: maltose alpha-D-glucosyltransferase [Candidatus Brocadiaceae bacterium]|nr:maltose alpha-D-glucosyltransferase [Candidatus Brocadiaceae bacterium]
MQPKDMPLSEDPLWYKDAIIYELHVKAFFDSSGDGIGDFRGVTEKLDYLENLGVTALWLLPFYPSPLKDDGYDIANYFGIHPDYGTLRDFKIFIKEAHKRGLKVITELVLNHTSDQHKWFQASQKAKQKSKMKDFYVWSDTSEKYKDARIIFKDFEHSNWTWDPVSKAYYWHRFYSHQPDLNFTNPVVQKEMLRIIDYWLDMGVDGFRLDAVPYLYEREGTNCENLPETHDFLKKLRAHTEGTHKGAMLLAEANQWPEDAVAYFGKEDECHMSFHFPLMPRLFMSVWMEDRFPIIDIFDQTPLLPETCQWALFLRNHDELTLEMVTDEERDYMYQVYASDTVARINLGIRRRLAPLLGNNKRKIELMNALLFSLPGTPIIYYGDEIGMGDNFYLGDRNGVRTPMQWNVDRNAGFSRVNPQKLYLPVITDPEYHYEAINVENQERNRASLLWWMKRMISMRKRFKAFGRGSIEFLFPDNPKVLAFIRCYQDESILVVMNLSRFAQVVELDLSKFSNATLEDVFSGNKFPKITEAPYVLTINRHDYYWFLIRKETEAVRLAKDESIPELSVSGTWEMVFHGKTAVKLEKAVLPAYLKKSRWFGGKALEIHEVKIIENISLQKDTHSTQCILLEVKYHGKESDIYLLSFSYAIGKEAEKTLHDNPQEVALKLKVDDSEGIVYDSVYDEEFQKFILKMIEGRLSVKGTQGRLVVHTGKKLKQYRLKELLSKKSSVLKAEQSNSSLLYDKELFFKLYRHLYEGTNPEWEFGRFLGEDASFSNFPAFIGGIEYVRKGKSPISIGILQSFVPNQGDAWTYTLDALMAYFDRVFAKKNEIQEMPEMPFSLVERASQDMPLLFQELIGGVYLEMATLLGKRTAELHIALSKKTDNSDFCPEPFSLLYQRSLYQSMQSYLKKIFALLRKNMKKMPENTKELADKVASQEKRIIELYRNVFKKKFSAMKIRIHGDYHLGQVLYTGNDFFIIDFEGEPARGLSERRLKKSVLKDVAGMIRSFHYVANSALLKHVAIRPEDIPVLEPWANAWHQYVSGIFLKSYVETTKNTHLFPENTEDFTILLTSFLLEKAVYELGYELNNRPEWVSIPIKGILQLLDNNE